MDFNGFYNFTDHNRMADSREIVLDLNNYSNSIMSRGQIHARDRCFLDPLLSYSSVILGREAAILVNLEHIKAIITAEEVWLRNPTDENVFPVVEVEDLKRRLKPVAEYQRWKYGVTDDFELHVLDVALDTVISYLSGRTTEMEIASSKPCSRDLDRKLRTQMAKLSQMLEMTARVRKVRDELKKFLECGYLPGNWEGTSPVSGSSSAPRLYRDENDVQESKMILERNKRINQLVQQNTFLYAASLFVGFLSLIIGIFGINILYTRNDGHEYMFKWVVVFATILCLCLFLFIGVTSYVR